eukprot:SAG31_NODE_16275_length_715_cov_3.472403_1_plen_34_part_10
MTYNTDGAAKAWAGSSARRRAQPARGGGGCLLRT